MENLNIWNREIMKAFFRDHWAEFVYTIKTTEDMLKKNRAFRI